LACGNRPPRALGGIIGRQPPQLLEELKDAMPAERFAFAVTHLQKQAAKVLAMDGGNLPDPRRTLNELGFDSLTGVEFTNRVGRSIGQTINPALLFDYPTLERFAGYVLRDVLQMESEEATAPTAEVVDSVAETEEHALDEVQNMSGDEMDDLVTRQLAKLEP
jgi:hypothetical protein